MDQITITPETGIEIDLDIDIRNEDVGIGPYECHGYRGVDSQMALVVHMAYIRAIRVGNSVCTRVFIPSKGVDYSVGEEVASDFEQEIYSEIS